MVMLLALVCWLGSIGLVYTGIILRHEKLMDIHVRYGLIGIFALVFVATSINLYRETYHVFL